MKYARHLAFAALALTLAWAVYAQAVRGVLVQTAPVVRGPIREFVDELGKTRLPDEHRITMPFAARIEPLTIREGQRVKQGDLIARLAPADLESELAEARAAVERFDAAIAENDHVAVELGAKQQADRFVESMEATVAAAEARKIAGQKKLDYSETFLARMRRLATSRAQSEIDLDRAELDFVQSQVDFRQDVLVAESLKAMQAATQLTPRMVLDYISRKSLGREVLLRQKSEATARLRQAELRMERSRLVSPIDGVVLERPVRDEQFLAAGTLLAKIGRLEELEVEADLLTQDAGELRPGGLAEIYGPAVGRAAGEGWRGVVERIYPAGFTKVSSLGVEEQRVRTVVRFAPDELQRLQAARHVGVDFRVRVRLFVESREQTLVAPRSAVFRSPTGRWETFVVRAGRAVLQPIEIGLLNDDSAEILSGVEAGEPVILAPEHGLADGDRVAPQAPADERS